MAKKGRAFLKSKFETGDIPTQQDYIDLLDSYDNLSEDTAPNTWYVNTNGDDANVGSDKFPFENLQAALDVYASRDTIIFQNPYYNTGIITVTIDKDVVIKGTNTNVGFISNIRGNWTVNAGVELSLENMTLNGIAFIPPGICTIFISNCTGFNVDTGTSRNIHLNIQNSNIEFVDGKSIRQLYALGCYLTKNLNIGLEYTFFSTSHIGNIVTGLDTSSDVVMNDSSVKGNVTITGNLEKVNSVITGTETVSGTPTSRQAKVFDDPTLFKGQATANTDTVKTSTATPVFDFNTGNDHQMTLDQNISSFTTTNEKGSGNYRVFLINDGSVRTVVAPTGWTKASTSQDHDTSANAVNLYQFYTRPDGTKYFNINIQ